MAMFPRAGRDQAVKRIKALNQIQETWTINGQPRLDGFLLREVGSNEQPSIRATPQQFYLQGAEFNAQEYVRDSVPWRGWPHYW